MAKTSVIFSSQNDKKHIPQEIKKTDSEVPGIRLEIASPLKGFAFAGSLMDVEVHAFRGREHCDHKEIVPLLGRKGGIDIVVDGDVTATAIHAKQVKAIYTATLKLKYIHEGVHTVLAVLPQKEGADSVKVKDSPPVNFVVDRTPPFIHTLNSENLIENNEDGSKCVVIDADDVHSGLDLVKCCTIIQNKTIKNAFKQENVLAFVLPKTLVEGSHKVKFVLIDMAGNEMQQVFECIIDNTPPVISSVWPSSILNKENAKFSKVLVEVKDAVSGLNVEECAVRIDGVMIGKAAVNEKGLEFPVKNVLKEGVHKIEITVLDNAGNGLNHVTKFSIDKTPPIIESISPDNGAILKKKEFPIVTIKANDPVSGVDLLRCRVILDDKVLELRSGNENEFIFAANYELDEGLHNLKAMIFDKAGNSVEHESSFSIIVEEAVVEEAVAGNEVIEDETDKVVEIADKDDIESVVAEPVEKDKADIEPVKGFDIAAIKEPPVIRSVFPANGICVNNRDLLSVVVEIESPVENLDLEKCEVILSGQSILKPIVFNDLLLFEIVNRIGQGEHKIKAIIFDLAGHKVENSSEFKVMSLPGNNKSCDERFGAVTEKMAGDKRFIKNLLMNFSDTVADEGLHSTKEMAIFQPPSISEAHADFMIENDNENVVEVRRTVAGKIKEALLKEMPSHLAKLNEDGALTKEGKLTECARETICAILQDPVNAIENIGVDLNEGEKKTIFPSFSRENAEELINWISVVHSR